MTQQSIGAWMILLTVTATIAFAHGGASAQVGGSAVAPGLSAIKEMIGQPVYNELRERLGRIDDLIIQRTAVSHVIVRTGGRTGSLVGLGRHPVAIPVKRLRREDGRFVFPGATAEAMKALPRFEYVQTAAREGGRGAAKGREVESAAPGVRDDPPILGLLLLLTGQTRKR